jgi:hypothetical protein
MPTDPHYRMLQLLFGWLSIFPASRRLYTGSLNINRVLRIGDWRAGYLEGW